MRPSISVLRFFSPVASYLNPSLVSHFSTTQRKRPSTPVTQTQTGRKGGGNAPQSRPTPSSPQSNNTKSNSTSSGIPLSNERLILAHRSVRVIDDTGANLGILDTPVALAAAKSKGLDLVLVNEEATPPVARILSLSAEMRKRKAAASAAKAVQSSRKVKEIRLTARTGEHDLAIKVDKVEGFLRTGNQVKVGVSFSGGGFFGKEESSRRVVMSTVARRVSEGGTGFCDPSSISGEGTTLYALFSPTSVAKPAAAWEPVFEKLASPLRTKGVGEGGGGGGVERAPPSTTSPPQWISPEAPPQRVAAAPARQPLSVPPTSAIITPKAVAQVVASPPPAPTPALPSAKHLIKSFPDALPVVKPGRKWKDEEGGGGGAGSRDLDGEGGDDEAPITRGRLRPKRGLK